MNDFKIVVSGDWRSADGTVMEFSRENSSNLIYFSGAVGFYHFLKGNFWRATIEWKRELNVILEIEKETNQRFHKGYFYYNIGVCYHNMGREDLAEDWRSKAIKEDQITYGENADLFPAQDGFNL